MANEQWKEISLKAKQNVLDAIPEEWKIPQEKLPGDDVLDVTGFPAQSGLLSPKELEITDTLATEIVQKLSTGEWTSYAVTLAFCKRASIAHQLTNCLTVPMFSSALERAQLLDQEFQKTQKPTGPLHGLPISIKDNFNIPNHPSSVGFCHWALEPQTTPSSIVTTLLSLGAIPFVKTNVPTAMMIAETVNNCHGRTLNPLNRATTSGGSSGGESALIALHGSPLGIGTDIGGSLRIPAACTGIYTLKPSAGRFPHFDARSGLAGQEAVLSVHGPMAHSIADLKLYAENVINTEPWRVDPKALPIPWRGPEIQAQLSLPQKKIKIAILHTNGLIHPTPPVTRALSEISEKLHLNPHYEILSWPATDHDEALELLGRFFLADGGKTIREILEPVGEPVRPEMESYGSAKEVGSYELWKLQQRRTALAKRYLDRWEAEGGLDAILGPTTPYAGAPKNGEFAHVGYTCVWNVLDYSCVSFPTGVCVDKGKDGVAKKEGGEVYYSEEDERTQKQFDAELSHGLPVSLQLTGRRLEEEKILALAERVVADIQ